jgi:hypothetical protein
MKQIHKWEEENFEQEKQGRCCSNLAERSVHRKCAYCASKFVGAGVKYINPAAENSITLNPIRGRQSEL